ncbi:MAG: hypothetical protein LJE95_01350 [Acidobacteria bacterium]|nr:hypothetical protein [Acidobacteriota bacterium]
MNQGSVDEQRCWESWLDEADGKYRIRIVTAMTAMIEREAALQPPLPFFTPHGIEHHEHVENRIHELIPLESYSQLEARERFYLLASAWLHDVGMLRSVANLYFGREAHVEEIRKLHHDIGRWYIINHFAECGLRERDRFFLAQLAFYHRKQEDLGRCRETMVVDGHSYRLRLLAGYLRLADALDVSGSRAPTSAYLVCLAYGIPPESKIHWIKSRLVSGIQVCHGEHRIKVQFQLPSQEELRTKNASMPWVAEKIQYVVDIVMNDLRDELASVMYTLTRAGFAFYIDLEKTESRGLDDRSLDDLLGLIMNYDILIAPSASKLLEMILLTIANIAGYNLEAGSPGPVQFRPMANPKKTADEIREFLAKIRTGMLGQRRCHYGVRSLVESCEHSEALRSGRLVDYVAEIDSQFQRQHDHRRRIRKNAAAFFEDHTQFSAVEGGAVTLLLFGYSELVIKAICGFRDRLMMEEGRGPEEIRSLYDSDLEKEFSRRFRIFICDGQSKTQTAQGDRLVYHDGFSYAQALKKRNFCNLILIPDIVTGNVIENQAVDLVLIGANGFDETCFKHSAGHGSIIKLAREHKQRRWGDPAGKPRVVLVVSSDKWRSASEAGAVAPAAADAATVLDVEGYPFWRDATGAATRDQVWFTRDNRLFGELKRKAEDNGGELDILLFNPREDVMPIQAVDCIISDAGFHLIADTTEAKTELHVTAFLDAIRAAWSSLPDHSSSDGERP